MLHDIALYKFNIHIHIARTRTAISRSTQLCRRLVWPPTSPFCWHQPSSSAAGQVDDRRQPTGLFGRYVAFRFLRPLLLLIAIL